MSFDGKVQPLRDGRIGQPRCVDVPGIDIDLDRAEPPIRDAGGSGPFHVAAHTNNPVPCARIARIEGDGLTSPQGRISARLPTHKRVGGMARRGQGEVRLSGIRVQV